MRAVRRLALLACLYFTQGLPFGFFSHAVPVLLNREHPPEIAGLSSLLSLPWAFKFLLGPTVDGLGPGRRWIAILPMQVLAIITLLVLALTGGSEKNLTPMLVGFFLVSLFSATQDVATDALAIDLVPPEDFGLAATVQSGAYRVGMIAGGGGLLAVSDQLGYSEGFFVMAGAIALASMPFITSNPERARGSVPRPAAAVRPAFGVRQHLRRLARFFVGRTGLRLLLFLFCFKFGDALAAGMVTRWFVKQGLTTTDIALTRGFVGGSTAIVGALIGGLLLRSMSYARSLQLFGALQGAAIFVYLVLAIAHPQRIGITPMPMSVYITASAVEHVFGGAATAVLFAHMMASTEDDARATGFTTQACALVMITGLGILLSGLITKWLTLPGLFAVASFFALASPLAIYVLPSKPRAASAS